MDPLKLKSHFFFKKEFTFVFNSFANNANNCILIKLITADGPGVASKKFP